MEEPERKLGPYMLVSMIGRGAFGVVWLAEKRSSIATTQFALKLPRDEDIDLETFKQEATIWLQASGHPNVVPMIEADIYDGQVVIVSEFVTEGSLASWLKRHGERAPSIEAASEMMEGVLSGLAHLHGRHIIHRDLKPDNILLQQETPRLTDFGIARLLKSGSNSTNVSGTLAYMAPEAFDGKRNEQTDIWSAGVIFYQLLSGRLPYDQPDMASYVGAIIRNDPPPLPGSVPEDLRLVVMKALQREPSGRYTSANDMRRELREAEHKLWQKQTSPTVIEPLEPPPARIPKPTTQILPALKTEKLDDEKQARSIEPEQPPIVESKSSSRGPLWLAGLVGVLLLGALAAFGIYRWVTTNAKVDTSKVRFALKQTLTGHSDKVDSVVFSPDGNTLASRSADKTVKLWDANTGVLKQTINTYDADTFSVAYSPDGKTLAIPNSKNITLCDAQTGVLKRTLIGHNDWVFHVAFSPDGKSLASGSFDYTIKLWDVQTGTMKSTLIGHESYVWALAFSPDGRKLASGSADKNVKLWDVESGTSIKTMKGHEDRIYSIAFSPDGTLIASGSDDKTVKLWDVQTGALKRNLIGHDLWVWGVAFSPDGRTLVSGSWDKSVRLWDTESGNLEQTLIGHEDKVLSVAYSPDGKTLASSSKDMTIKLWHVE